MHQSRASQALLAREAQAALSRASARSQAKQAQVRDLAVTVKRRARGTRRAAGVR